MPSQKPPGLIYISELATFVGIASSFWVSYQKYIQKSRSKARKFKEAPYNFFKPMPSSLIGARWLRHSLPYTTIPRLYPDVRVFMAPGAFD